MLGPAHLSSLVTPSVLQELALALPLLFLVASPSEEGPSLTTQSNAPCLTIFWFSLITLRLLTYHLSPPTGVHISLERVEI